MIIHERLKKIGTVFIGFGTIFVLWHLISLLVFLPPPLQVFQSLVSMWLENELLNDIWASLARILTGFGVALFVAIVLGILAARFSLLFNLVKIPMDIISSVPPIAWTPLAILWFGIGNAPAYFIVFLGAFFPVFINVYAGITKVDSEYIAAARVLGASPTLLIRKIIFPASLPQIFTGIQTGISVAWFNVIAAELIGVRSGLGYKIQLHRTLLSVENVIALMIVIGVLGFLMTYITRSIGRLVAPWAIQDDSRKHWAKLRRHFIALVSMPFQVINLPKDSKLPVSEIATTEKIQPSTSSTPLLQVNNLYFSYESQNSKNKLTVLDGVSFKVGEGEVFSIIGPNGSGKTTTLKIIAGLVQPGGGEIRFKGEKVLNPDNGRTLVFQNFALFPWMTCRGNIEFAISASQKSRARGIRSFEDQIVEKLLTDVGLLDFAEAYPTDLSGGMKQRLAIARALAVYPELLLLDEAFSSLDPLNKHKSQEYILELLAKYRVTVLLVTHDLEEAVFMSDKVLVLSSRPAKVKKIVNVDLPQPRMAESRKTKEFQRLHACLWKSLHT